VIFALAEILGLEKFGEADYFGAASGGVGYALQCLVKILFRVGAAGHLHQGYAEFVRGHAGSSPSNIAGTGFGYQLSACQFGLFLPGFVGRTKSLKRGGRGGRRAEITETSIQRQQKVMNH
jgi:hypothetical protein